MKRIYPKVLIISRGKIRHILKQNSKKKYLSNLLYIFKVYYIRRSLKQQQQTFIEALLCASHHSNVYIKTDSPNHISILLDKYYQYFHFTEGKLRLRFNNFSIQIANGSQNLNVSFMILDSVLLIYFCQKKTQLKCHLQSAESPRITQAWCPGYNEHAKYIY